MGYKVCSTKIASGLIGRITHIRNWIYCSALPTVIMEEPIGGNRCVLSLSEHEQV